MKIIKTICIGVTAALSSLPTFAQQTYEELVNVCRFTERHNLIA